MKLKMALLFLFFVQVAAAQTDEAIFDQIQKLPQNATKAETALGIAHYFLGKSYVAHSLEKTPEQLVLNLRQFDCYTFVENVLALTTTRQQSGSYQDYQELLRQLRYRAARINGYGSRLHYFLEWAQQAQANGLLRDVSQELGGVAIQKKINFMSAHQALYPAFGSAQAQIAEAEQKLSESRWFYIPKNQVAAVENKLQNGDIVAFTSAKTGLDFNHEGFVVIKNKRAYLLHASSEHKKVLLSSETLLQYLLRIKDHSGLVILRFVR